MKQTITIGGGSFILALLIAFGIVLAPVQAHNGVSHGSEAEATAHADESETAEIAKLEKIVTLLNQLLLLINALHIQQGYAPVVVDTALEMDDHHADESMHHDEQSSDPASSDPEEVAHLVIEIEPHNNQTHAHVRYVDKPEEMFFVSADIDDEDGIVSAIHEKTGLSKDDVREALKYMQ